MRLLKNRILPEFNIQVKNFPVKGIRTKAHRRMNDHARGGLSDYLRSTGLQVINWVANSTLKKKNRMFPVFDK